jgi:hypothetical protein
MSASKNLHDNIFEIFAGITQDHIKKVLNEDPPSDEYKMSDWLDDIKRNDVWASDALWNSVDLSYYIPVEHYRTIKEAIATAIVNNDIVSLGQIFMGYMHPYIQKAIKQRNEHDND